MEEKNINRRGFIINTAKIIGGCGAAISLMPLLQSCENFLDRANVLQGKQVQLDISNIKELNGTIDPDNNYPNGWGIEHTFPDMNYGIPVIIVRLKDDSQQGFRFVCFSSMCTHQHCFGDNVKPPTGDFYDIPELADEKYITCTCHGSKFDPYNNAAVINGPAEKPLRQYPVSFDAATNILTISY